MIPQSTTPAPEKLAAAYRAEQPFYRATLEVIRSIAAPDAFWPAVAYICQQPGQKATTVAELEKMMNALTPYSMGQLLWTLNKNVTDPFHRMSIAKAVVALSPPTPSAETADAPLAAELKQTGFLQLPELLTPAQIAEMAKHFETRSAFVQDGPTYSNTVEDIVAAPHALSFATHPRILSLVKEYLGGAPTIVDLCAWWTIPSPTDDYGAHIFHRDKDDFRALKLFLYTTDVETEDGPHIFARFTHDPAFTKDYLARNGLSPELMKPLFEGNGRLIADSIPQLFGNHISEITGKAGTSFLEGTYGFHRGKTAKRRRRGLFQVLYATIPYPLRLQRFAPVALDKLPGDCIETDLSRHATRLLFKPH